MLEIDNVTKIYGQGENSVIALRDIQLIIGDGDFTAIVGPSGSGKSTLLNIIGGLDSPSSGEIRLHGERLDGLDENSLVQTRRGKLAYIFQQYHLLPSLTALENVMLPLVFTGAAQRREKAEATLEQVGLSKRIEHRPDQLSGGEQQRVAIARALVNNPMIILADEPTGNLDQRTGMDILQLFHSIHDQGRTILIVTHNREIASQAGKQVVFRDGMITDIL